MSVNKKVKLIRISPKTLIVGQKLEYTLYKHEEGEVYTKFLVQEQEYNLDVLKSIEEKNIQNLYVAQKDFKKYIKKGTRDLFEMIEDDGVDLLIKSEVMYQLTCELMFDILNGKITKEKIDELSKTVDVAIELVHQEEKAIKTMIASTTHDYETHSHCVEVSTYALCFGYYLGFTKEQIKRLAMGAILHDIGKTRVPKEIVNKNGFLHESEFRIMKDHPFFGADILREVGITDKSILAIVEQHHEKVDGSGYPRGLKIDQIHIFAQIISICDIFNSITTKKTYRDKKTSFEALSFMNSEMRGKLNPKAFAKFISFMAEK